MNPIKKHTDLWGPFDLISDLQTDLNRAFSRSLTRREDWERGFYPSIEVKEEPDQYLLCADLPGLKREDIHISIQGNQVTLKGERKQEREVKKEGAYFSERIFGAFSRTAEFPTEIQSEKVKATYKDGVLEVVLPKSESSKPKQINVEVK